MATTTEEDPIHDKPMPLLEHLVVLRRRLMISMAAFLIAFLVCYYFSRTVYSFLAAPLATAMAAHTGGNRALIYTHLTAVNEASARAAVARLLPPRPPTPIM